MPTTKMRVTGLHHVGIRVGSSTAQINLAKKFYRNVLGLRIDPGRPGFAAGGHWIFTGSHGQIHTLGFDAENGGPKGTMPHIALGVADMEAAQTRLEGLGIEHSSAIPFGLRQFFLLDPFGNVIELHEQGQCSCIASHLP